MTGSLDNSVSWYSVNGVGRLSFLGYLKDGENGVDGLRKARISYYLMTVFLLIFRLPRQSDQLL